MDYMHLVALRRDIHAHPELGYAEHRTADIVANFLEELGLDVHRGIGQTGVVGILKRGNGTRIIGLRADIDALPMPDDGKQVWKSQHEGACHACGHDGHTTMLLGAAEYLAKHGDFNGTVCFIFQPAEEGKAGARAMIEDGLFQRFPCEQIFAVHNWPELPVGVAQTRVGAIMAAGDRFDIRVYGGGGHAAQPHLSPDTLLAASELVVQLHTIVSRSVNPVDQACLTITKFHGGTAYNMIPAEAHLAGTVRTLSHEVRTLVKNRMLEIAQHVTAMHGLKVEINYFEGYPATINTAEAVDIALKAATNAGLTASEAPFSAMTSEDFSFMLQEKSGAYLWLGSGESKPLHHPAYDFNDDLIPYGVRWFVEVVRETLR
ncbi:MAG: M20 aminoacylase family protein [Acinetobacter sp.]